MDFLFFLMVVAAEPLIAAVWAIAGHFVVPYFTKLIQDEMRQAGVSVPPVVKR